MKMGISERVLLNSMSKPRVDAGKREKCNNNASDGQETFKRVL